MAPTTRAAGLDAQMALENIREHARSIDNVDNFIPRFPLYIRMKHKEKHLLLNELMFWDHHITEELGGDQGHRVVHIALLLFLRWTWSSEAFRVVLEVLSLASIDSQKTSDELMMMLAHKLASRNGLGALPFDVRNERVQELLNDHITGFFRREFKESPGVMASLVSKIGVVPHPEDWNVW
ncbi:hypothetical protein QBC40DRAFT_326852 [Triangularia verruculosa]|uniref:Uncharacterized protein n=1 Tax=Triangularia verruculosa TaxID=2587418 RepID=A0AAN6XGU4_9PEZI|nr:hypothetical protein QBC40DRAFT_326852 [Triangularia verruculosa]